MLVLDYWLNVANCCRFPKTLNKLQSSNSSRIHNINCIVLYYFTSATTLFLIRNSSVLSMKFSILQQPLDQMNDEALDELNHVGVMTDVG